MRTLIVCWSDGTTDRYRVFEAYGEAEAFYNELLQQEDLYSASICKIIKSTDYVET